MSEPTVAVIIPARDAERYLDQALASLVTQTRAPDEVIVVDDGSVDETFARATFWTGRLPLRVLRLPEPAGAWYARNVAAGHATSMLIAQLDADDLVLPQHLELLVAAYLQRPGLVAPRRLLWEFPATATFSVFPERTPDPPDQLVQLLLQNYLSAGALYPRRVFEEIGGYQALRYGQDWDLWIRMAAAGLTIVKPQTPTYVYRMHPQNISSHVPRDRTDIAVLRGFLDSASDKHLRFVAKLSLLQRMGERFVLEHAKPQRRSAGELHAPDDFGISPQMLFTVVADDDLGQVALGFSPEVSGELYVFSPTRQIVLSGRSVPGGFEVDHAPPGLAWNRHAIAAEGITRLSQQSGGDSH